MNKRGFPKMKRINPKMLAKIRADAQAALDRHDEEQKRKRQEYEKQCTCCPIHGHGPRRIG